LKPRGIGDPPRRAGWNTRSVDAAFSLGPPWSDRVLGGWQEQRSVASSCSRFRVCEATMQSTETPPIHSRPFLPDRELRPAGFGHSEQGPRQARGRARRMRAGRGRPRIGNGIPIIDQEQGQSLLLIGHGMVRLAPLLSNWRRFEFLRTRHGSRMGEKHTKTAKFPKWAKMVRFDLFRSPERPSHNTHYVLI